MTNRSFRLGDWIGRRPPHRLSLPDGKRALQRLRGRPQRLQVTALSAGHRLHMPTLLVEQPQFPMQANFGKLPATNPGPRHLKCELTNLSDLRRWPDKGRPTVPGEPTATGDRNADIVVRINRPTRRSLQWQGTAIENETLGEAAENLISKIDASIARSDWTGFEANLSQNTR
jgi:hypothetical protein